MISSLLHLVGLRPRVYYTLTNFRGGAKAPLAPPLNTPMVLYIITSRSNLRSIIYVAKIKLENCINVIDVSCILTPTEDKMTNLNYECNAYKSLYFFNSLKPTSKSIYTSEFSQNCAARNLECCLEHRNICSHLICGVKGTWILFQFVFLMQKFILYAKIAISQKKFQIQF